ICFFLDAAATLNGTQKKKHVPRRRKRNTIAITLWVLAFLFLINLFFSIIIGVGEGPGDCNINNQTKNVTSIINFRLRDLKSNHRIVVAEGSRTKLTVFVLIAAYIEHEHPPYWILRATTDPNKPEAEWLRMVLQPSPPMMTWMTLSFTVKSEALEIHLAIKDAQPHSLSVPVKLGSGNLFAMCV
ncbi:unnamed protein product, partial [Meganyctiphanes norvegica]